jgi:hypothetical protein
LTFYYIYDTLKTTLDTLAGGENMTVGTDVLLLDTAEGKVTPEQLALRNYGAFLDLLKQVRMGGHPNIARKSDEHTCLEKVREAAEQRVPTNDCPLKCHCGTTPKYVAISYRSGGDPGISATDLYCESCKPLSPEANSILLRPISFLSMAHMGTPGDRKRFRDIILGPCLGIPDPITRKAAHRFFWGTRPEKNGVPGKNHG